MRNYNNGKIYKVEPIVDHEEHEIYIGSTTKDKLCQRMATHRRDYTLWKQNKCGRCMSYELFEKYGLENCNIVLIELVNANSKDELLSRESYFIKTLKCVNKQLSIQTNEERQQYLENYKLINKDIISEKNKKYREEHQEQIIKYREEHKKECSEKKKEWYNKNKDKYKTKYDSKSQKCTCDCGSEIRMGEKMRHEKSIKHQNYINSLPK